MWVLGITATIIRSQCQLKQNCFNGDNTMIGVNSLIILGVTIGNRVIVVGGTVVTKDISDGVVVAGVSAKIIGRYLEFVRKRYRNID